MQMSYERIIQSLLYLLSIKAPAIMCTIFPYWFEAGISLGDQILKVAKMVWVWEELNKAFRSVIRGVRKTHEVMLFMYGLNEFAGDSSEVIDLAANLLSASVNVGISSQPWVVFEDDYGHCSYLDRSALNEENRDLSSVYSILIMT